MHFHTTYLHLTPSHTLFCRLQLVKTRRQRLALPERKRRQTMRPHRHLCPRRKVRWIWNSLRFQQLLS